MKRFGIIVNLTKDIGLKATSSIINWLESRGCTAMISEVAASKINRLEIGYSQSEIFKQSDMLIVLGGDGTLLGVSRQLDVLENGTPILGVNMGHLGFITEVEKEDTIFALEKILEGDFKVQERMVIEACVIRENNDIEKFYCLNDVGITKGTLSRMITLRTYADDTYIDSYHADGLLISTPTGSTAYSLSAGGPIVSPELHVMLMTPICPHTLYSRSIVISDSQVLTVEIADSYEEVFITCDGQQGRKLTKYDKIIIKKAPYNVRLVKLSNRSFFDVLRNKLKQRNI